MVRIEIRRPAGLRPLLLAGLFLLSSQMTLSQGVSHQISDAKMEMVHTAIGASGDFLAGQIREDGSFVYHVHINPAIKLKPFYNWVRHAGAIMVLEDYYHLSGKEELIPLMKMAADRMRTDSIRPVEGIPNATAVWEDGIANGLEDRRFAILGGAGLGLLALVRLNEIAPNAVPKGELEALANFILAMVKPTGDVYPTWDPEVGGPSDEWASPFNAGEAALGLIALYEATGEPKWLDSAKTIFGFLIDSRANLETGVIDHWALLATSSVWPHLQASERPLYREHARKIVAAMLATQVRNNTIHDGTFGNIGTTTTTATMLEGILAAEFLFREEAEFHRNVLASIEAGMKFLFNAQIRNGPFAGAITRSVSLMPLDKPEAMEFNSRASVVRIDYIQHVLNAFILYEALLSYRASLPENK